MALKGERNPAMIVGSVLCRNVGEITIVLLGLNCLDCFSRWLYSVN